MEETEKKVRIAAISDTHVRETSHGQLEELCKEISLQTDLLIIAGDITDHGLPTEAKVAVEELKYCTIPKLAVLGNHDHESGKPREVSKILQDGGVKMMEEEAFELDNVGFTGTKGFGGGFGQYVLHAFGETETKAFVQAALDEVKKLENGLGKLTHLPKKVVLMHYAPIVGTNKGEPVEIYPFLGTTRFEEVIDRFDVDLVFHGHSHYGSLEGKTAKGARVYNVASPLLQKATGKPYRIVEI